MQETQETHVQSVGQKDPLKEGMATLSSILAWESLLTEEPGGLQSMGSQRVEQNWVTKHSITSEELSGIANFRYAECYWVQAHAALCITGQYIERWVMGQSIEPSSRCFILSSFPKSLFSSSLFKTWRIPHLWDLHWPWFGSSDGKASVYDAGDLGSMATHFSTLA